jgi:hypothetical protein
MTLVTERKERPLKVCCTCCYWSAKHKGLCTRLNQGAGKFWICQDWTDAGQNPESHGPGSNPEAAGQR